MSDSKSTPKVSQQPKLEEIQNYSDSGSTDDEDVIYPKNWDHNKGRVVSPQPTNSNSKRKTKILLGSSGMWNVFNFLMTKIPEVPLQKITKQDLECTPEQRTSQKTTLPEATTNIPHSDTGADQHSVYYTPEPSTADHLPRSSRPIHRCQYSYNNFLCCSTQVRWLQQRSLEKRLKNNSKLTDDRQSTPADDELSDIEKSKPELANKKVLLTPKPSTLESSNPKVVVRSPMEFRRELYHDAEALTEPVLDMMNIDKNDVSERDIASKPRGFRDLSRKLRKVNLQRNTGMKTRKGHRNSARIHQTPTNRSATEKEDEAGEAGKAPRIQVFVAPPRNFNKDQYVVCNRVEGLRPLCFDPSEYEYYALESC